MDVVGSLSVRATNSFSAMSLPNSALAMALKPSGKFLSAIISTQN